MRGVAQQVRTRGFGILDLSLTQRDILDKAVAEFTLKQQFRFPWGNQPEFTLSYKVCFNFLCSLGVDLLREFIPDAPRIDQLPFPSLSEQIPFNCENSVLSYSSSFFNIFNYDYGSLNTHRDRCLLTLVWGFSDVAAKNRTRLWCLSNGDWVDLEEFVSRGSLAVFVGEELELQSHGEFRAAPHCVRVDPRGTCIPLGCRDPTSAPTGNRRSVAFVLDWSPQALSSASSGGCPDYSCPSSRPRLASNA
jgi:hypothetical protein